MSGGIERAREVLVTHWGAVTPVGRTARESAFGFRASVNGLRESAILSNDGEALTMATIPILDPHLEGLERLLTLARASLAEVLERTRTALYGARVKAFVVLDEPSSRDELGQASSNGRVVAQAIRDDLFKALGVTCGVEIEESGPTGLCLALARIADEQESNQYDAAFVVAAHTDYCLERARVLESAGRVYSSENLDAVLLGEGAVALLIPSAATARHIESDGGVFVAAEGLRREAARIDNDESAFTAAALTVLAREATSRVPTPVGWVSSDASFELFRIYELQAVMVRLSGKLGPPQVLDAPNQRIGHLGAALGAFQIMFAGEAFLRGFAPSSECLCLLGSDQGIRSAMLLRAKTPS